MIGDCIVAIIKHALTFAGPVPKRLVSAWFSSASRCYVTLQRYGICGNIVARCKGKKIPFLFIAFQSSAQETAPLKNFEYNISLNRLKTQGQADQIKEEVSLLPGVKNCDLILIEYNIHFECTNHDMTNHIVMDRVKAIILENGSEIINIKRTEKWCNL